MDAARQQLTYVWIFVAVSAAALLPVVGLNFMLGMRSLGGGDVAVRASAWQEATRGVTYSPPLSNSRPFKSARLFDRLPEINAVVFGSSSAMGITQSMFPPGIAAYNFAQTGNRLLTVISEAEFLQRRQPGVKWLVIPLDWALGFLYEPGTPGPENLAPPASGTPAPGAEVPLARRLADAVSLPRVKNLLGILAQIARAPAPAHAFREMFLQDESDEYRCADGTPARDYDTIFRGTCTGFRYDGSATFANLEPVPVRRAGALIASAVVPSSKYSMALTQSGGVPNPVILERLAVLAQEMKTRHGGALFFLPPLLPGLERALLDSPHTRGPLMRTKQELEQWARAHGLVIIDAGQSERYGCVAPEFVDEHHALPACYARIFSRFWRDRPGPGLWRTQ